MSSSPLAAYWNLVKTVLRRGTPVLGLELRIHGRQWRTFILRAMYVAMLTIYIGLMWQAVVEQARSHLGQAAAQNVMSDAGRHIVGNVILFQFIAGQVAAIALMCTAFSGETAHGRLPTLLTTPLSPVQIVAGKYLSGLVQLLVLMLTTLPVLAIVRVFGGVPWWDLVLGTMFSVMAALFTGAATLLASIKEPKAPKAALQGAAASAGLLLIFGITRVVAATSLGMPIYVFLILIVLLAIGIGVIGLRCIDEFPLAVQRVIGKSLPTSLPYSDKSYANYAWFPPVPDDPNFRQPFATPLPAEEAPAPMEHVQGEPLVWRATRRLNKSLTPKALLMAMGLILTYVYGGALLAGGLDAAGYHRAILLILMAMVSLWLGFLAAISITMEKETGQWPLVLTTPMEDSSIFVQKLRVILARSWVLGAAVLAHTVIFVVLGVMHPLALVQLPLLFAWQGLFVIALGVYCSARNRTSSAAALMTGAVLVVLWLVVPVAARLVGQGIYGGSDGFGNHLLMWAALGNPFSQLTAMLSGDIRSQDQFHPLQWVDGQTTFMGLLEYLLQWLFWMVTYTLAGGALIWRAVRSFRRNLYEAA